MEEAVIYPVDDERRVIIHPALPICSDGSRSTSLPAFSEQGYEEDEAV